MDKEKIDEIYRENAAMIYKYLCGLTQDSGLAEELTQETFFQANEPPRSRATGYQTPSFSLACYAASCGELNPKRLKGLTNLGEIVKFPSGYAELPKKYGIKNWKKKAGIKPPHWTIRYLPQKMLKVKV